MSRLLNNNGPIDRNASIRAQSPAGVQQDYKAAINMYHEQSGILDEIPESHVLSDMFRRETGSPYAVHHIVPIRTYNRLFTNTTPEQGKQLQEILHSGNHHKNLFIAPDLSHDGVTGGFLGVHTRLKNAGLQVSGKTDQQLHPMVVEMENSADLPFEAKVNLAKRFKAEIVPMFHQHLNEALQENDKWANAKGRAQAYKEGK